MNRIKKLSIVLILLTIFNGSCQCATIPDWAKSYYNNAFFSIASNSKIDVTVGNSGNIYSSQDDKKWTKQISNTEYALYKIVYGKDTFVAVGECGTVISSKDGINWSQAKLNTTDSLNNVMYINNKYIIPANHKIYISDDAVKWISVKTIDNLSNITEMIYFKGKYIGIINNYIAASSDLLNWKMIKKNGKLLSITTDGKTAVAAGGCITCSNDGLNWKYELKYDSEKIFKMAESIIYAAPITTLKTYSIRYTNKQFVGVLVANGSNPVGTGCVIYITSKDGHNWTMNVLNCLEYNTGYVSANFTFNPNGKQMAFTCASCRSQLSSAGRPGSDIVVSNDGTHWQMMPASDYQTHASQDILYITEYLTSILFSDIIWDGKKFIAVGEGLSIAVVDGNKYNFVKMPEYIKPYN